MKLKKYDLIFVVLTYKNVNDIVDFKDSLCNIKNGTYHVIVINSYYDQQSSDILKKFTHEMRWDFIEVDNRGYGYGNNIGIKYAKSNYTFGYLVISNPDILIFDLDYQVIKTLDSDIIAPKITTLKNKNQNPYYFKRHNILEYIYFLSFKFKLTFVKYFPILIYKIERIIANVSSDEKIVYATHGSFMIIKNKVIDKLPQIFNENMFLFAEENHLSKLFEVNNFVAIYTQKIRVLHKEDGSMGKPSKFLNNTRRNSFIEYYQYWRRMK